MVNYGLLTGATQRLVYVGSSKRRRWWLRLTQTAICGVLSLQHEASAGGQYCATQKEMVSQGAVLGIPRILFVIRLGQKKSNETQGRLQQACVTHTPRSPEQETDYSRASLKSAHHHQVSHNMSIQEATKQCLETLRACLAVEQLMIDAWAENRLADLNLWIAGLGALASSRVSLDTRLGSKPEIRDIIANLLGLLALTVEKCRRLATSESGAAGVAAQIEEEQEELSESSSDGIPPRPYSPWSDEDDSDSDDFLPVAAEQPLSTNSLLESNMQDVGMLLKQLANIAVVVRKSGKGSRLQRADQQFKPEEHKDLQAHLTTMMLLNNIEQRSDLHSVNGTFDPSNLGEIQERIIQCNLKRRNRFLYAQRHSDSLSGRISQEDDARRPQKANPGVMAKPAPDGSESQSQAAVPSTEIEQVQEPTNPTIVTGTRATAISDSLDIPRFYVSVLLSDASYGIFGGEKVEAERKHISNDLSPYTCILRGCTTPNVLYATKSDWHRHLLDRHQGYEYWICFACEGAEQFRNKEQFRRHIEVHHTSFMRTGQISLLEAVCKRYTPLDITSCPLCNRPKGHGQETEVDKTGLFDHIAKELHAFSLRSLPWNDDCGQESEQRICQSSEKVSEWLAKNSLYAETTSEKPPLERRVHSSSYFQHSPYFADSTGSDSSSGSESYASIDKGLEDLEAAQGPDFLKEDNIGVNESEQQSRQSLQSESRFCQTSFVNRNSHPMQEEEPCCGCGRPVEVWRPRDSGHLVCERCRQYQGPALSMDS
ncbi:uncharacterized protein TRIREDRAFT_105458, partial [Trichoderma reesei QM6a]